MSEVRAFSNQLLDLHLGELSGKTNSDVLYVNGPMDGVLPQIVRQYIEGMKDGDHFNGNLSIVLHTFGGSIGSVERMVTTIRKFYNHVDFIIPDCAMSAGTVFAMSGDNIYMDYFSLLGPVDPQFSVNDKWVPGLAYLEEFEVLNNKSKDGTLTPLEYAIAEKLDLADLNQYNEARKHSVELIEAWLSTYKFKNWSVRETSKEPVTDEYKKRRAREIADHLNNTQRWHSHGRGISIDTIRSELNLKIEDLDQYPELAFGVKTTHTFMLDYMSHFSTNSFARARSRTQAEAMEKGNEDKK